MRGNVEKIEKCKMRSNVAIGKIVKTWKCAAMRLLEKKWGMQNAQQCGHWKNCEKLKILLAMRLVEKKWEMQNAQQCGHLKN